MPFGFKWSNAVVLAGMIFVTAACTSRAHPEAKLLGKWQTDANKFGIASQFEFLPDGNIIKNEKTKTLGWTQLGAGTFNFIDQTHVKVELQPSGYFGVSIYEVIFQDNDHVGLRSGDQTIQLSRVR